MTKICHITTMHQPFDTRIFKKECVSLVNNGFDVTLIAPHDKEEIRQGVKIIPIRSRTSFIDRIYHLPKLAIEVLDNVNADIYHFHDPELVPFMQQVAKSGKRVIWDAHENYKDTIKSFNSLKIKPLSFLGSEFFNWMELRASKNHFAGVVTITDKMASKYQKQNIKTCVLSNYANISHFEYNGEPKISSKPRLISSGAHFRPRAITEIAKSFEFIKNEIDAELYFSGKFVDEDLKKEVKEIASQLDPSGKKIIIEGALEYDDLINRAIPQAWVGTVLFDVSDPNNRNGLPNRFFECWANGVPVITTDGTQVAKVVKEYGGGVVIKDNSPQAIAEAFIKIAGDRAFRNKLSKEAFECVSKEMNWESNFKQLLKFYKEILKN